MSAVTFGLFFSDAGLAIGGTGTSGGAGLVLPSSAGSPAPPARSSRSCVRPAAGPAAPARWAGRAGPRLGPVVMLILAGLGVAASFAPAWDSFTLHTAAGQTQSLTVGDAFAATRAW